MELARNVAGPIASAAMAILLASGASRAQTPGSLAWSYEHDMTLTYEVDDNVSEEIADPVSAQVARLTYRGDLRLGSTGEQRLTLSYQGGFKGHFGSLETDVTSQFINE